MTDALSSQKIIFLFVFMVHAMALSIQLARESQNVMSVKSAMRLSLSQESVEQPEIKTLARPRPAIKPQVSQVQPQPEKKETLAEKTQIQDQSSQAVERKVDPLKLYGSKVQDLIQKKKIYPPLARRMDQQGSVLLRLSLDRTGKLMDLRMLKASEFTILNNAALDMVKRVESFPPIPSELGIDIISFNVPVDYKIK